jgi:hypothetical protein
MQGLSVLDEGNHVRKDAGFQTVISSEHDLSNTAFREYKFEFRLAPRS